MVWPTTRVLVPLFICLYAIKVLLFMKQCQTKLKRRNKKTQREHKYINMNKENENDAKPSNFCVRLFVVAVFS